MKIKEIIQLNEGFGTAKSHAYRLDSFVRSPVLHYLDNSETPADAANGLMSYLQDHWDDFEHNDRDHIKKIIAMLRKG